MGARFGFSILLTMVVVVGASSLALAQGRVFQNPAIDGYRLDICREWGSNCGQPAADAFCQRMGFSGSSNHVEASNIGAQTPTKVISSGQICDQSYCDGFAAITCVGGVGPGQGPGNGPGVGPGGGPGGMHGNNVFTNPSINGYRLDICREWGSNCGQPAADAFCQSMGFSGSSSHEAAMDIGAATPTMVISSGQVCDQSYCDGFSSITCVGGGGPGQGPGNGPGVGPGGMHGNNVFPDPSIDGYRLDICREWATNCGQPAADAFCQRMGYSGAAEFVPVSNIGAQTPTKVIGSGQICDQAFCGGFSSITCQ